MATQNGFMKITGTIGGITFYKMNNKYYARKKTSLDKARVLSDPAFAGSRKSSAIFGRASSIAKRVYQRFSAQQKGHGVIGILTAKANKMLHAGHSAQAVLVHLIEQYLGPSATELLRQVAINNEATKQKLKQLAQEQEYSKLPDKILIPHLLLTPSGNLYKLSG